MRADELRRELQEIADDQSAIALTNAAAVMARGKQRLFRRRLGVGLVVLAVVGTAVGIAASARSGADRGVVVSPTPTLTTGGPQVIFTSESEGWVCGDPIRHTADGGQHWQSQSWAKLAPGTPTCAAVPTEAWIVVQAADGSVKVLPAQGGAHIAVTIGFPRVPDGAKVVQATFIDRENGWVLVRPAANAPGHGLLYRTTEGGARFTLVSSRAPIDRVAFMNATEGWGIEQGSIKHTVDGGATWNEPGGPTLRTGRENGTFHGLAVRGGTVIVAGVALNPQTALNQVVFFVSTDRGQTWGAIPGPAVAVELTDPSALEIIDATQWRLLIGGKLWATGDQHRWTEIDAPANLASIAFPSIESNWVTDADGVLYQWSDAGPRWNRVDTTPQPDWRTNLVAIPGDATGCPTVAAHFVGTDPQQAARDFVQATRGWTGEKLVASYPVTQPGGQFGELFAANVPRQCGQAVADASYAVELTNPSVTQDSSRSTALVVAPIGGEWKVWGFYR
jgi:hypothetical protein